MLLLLSLQLSLHLSLSLLFVWVCWVAWVCWVLFAGLLGLSAGLLGLSAGFAGLWRPSLAAGKNFVNLTWDCYLGNPNERSLYKKWYDPTAPLVYTHGQGQMDFSKAPKKE